MGRPIVTNGDGDALFPNYFVQVSLSGELSLSQVAEFRQMIPVQLALPPWNYTASLENGITVRRRCLSRQPSVNCRLYQMCMHDETFPIRPFMSSDLTAPAASQPWRKLAIFGCLKIFGQKKC